MKNTIALGLLVSLLVGCGSSSSNPAAPAGAVTAKTGAYSYIKGAKAIASISGASLAGGIDYVGMGEVIIGADGQPIKDYLVTTPNGPVFFAFVYPAGNGQLLLGSGAIAIDWPAVLPNGELNGRKPEFTDEVLPSGEKASDCPQGFYLYNMNTASIKCALPVGSNDPLPVGGDTQFSNGKILGPSQDKAKRLNTILLTVQLK